VSVRSIGIVDEEVIRLRMAERGGASCVGEARHQRGHQSRLIGISSRSRPVPSVPVRQRVSSRRYEGSLVATRFVRRRVGTRIRIRERRRTLGTQEGEAAMEPWFQEFVTTSARSGEADVGLVETRFRDRHPAAKAAERPSMPPREVAVAERKIVRREAGLACPVAATRVRQHHGSDRRSGKHRT